MARRGASARDLRPVPQAAVASRIPKAAPDLDKGVGRHRSRDVSRLFGALVIGNGSLSLKYTSLALVLIARRRLIAQG
jgi:hypothetical protein